MAPRERGKTPAGFRAQVLQRLRNEALRTGPVHPIAQHLAEKLHAYTLPRGQENTRVRDLVDLVVIAATQQIESDRLSRSVDATFAIRRTHLLPERLPEPPVSWAQPFAAIAAEAADLPATNLREGHVLAAQFWDPFLADRGARRVWLPGRRCWGKAMALPPEV